MTRPVKASRQSGSLAQPPREEGIMYTKHKYSDEVEQEIVAQYLAGESTVVLGRTYGSPRRTINSILARHGVERRKADSFPLRSNARLYGTDPNELRAMVGGVCL